MSLIKKLNKLIKKFGTISAVKKAELKQLIEAAGEKKGKVIYDFFRG